ncbi:MAG: hypothetical protein GY950_15315 [bacterium]|nr:hypothetical protein [bacterium]
MNPQKDGKGGKGDGQEARNTSNPETMVLPAGPLTPLTEHFSVNRADLADLGDSPVFRTHGEAIGLLSERNKSRREPNFKKNHQSILVAKQIKKKSWITSQG